MTDSTDMETISKLQNVNILSYLKESVKNCKSYIVALPIIHSRILLRELAMYAHEVDDPFLNIICAKLGLFNLRKSLIPRYISKQKSKTITQIMAPEEIVSLKERVGKIPPTSKAVILIENGYNDCINIHTYGNPQWIRDAKQKFVEIASDNSRWDWWDCQCSVKEGGNK